MERVDLLLKGSDLPLGQLDRVGAGDEAERGLLQVSDADQRPGELGGIAALLAVPGVPELDLLGSALSVVRDGGLGVRRRLLGEKLCAE
jgi:hypothetical protein